MQGMRLSSIAPGGIWSVRCDRCRRLFQLCSGGDRRLKTSLSPAKRGAVMPLSTRPHWITVTLALENNIYEHNA
jgi:hypothetical protein